MPAAPRLPPSLQGPSSTGTTARQCPGPWTESPFSRGVTKLIGMQLHPVPISSLWPNSPRGLGLPLHHGAAGSAPMGAPGCVPSLEGAGGPGTAPVPKGRGLSLFTRGGGSAPGNLPMTLEHTRTFRPRPEAPGREAPGCRVTEPGVTSAQIPSPAGPSPGTKPQTPGERQRCFIWKVNP